MIGKQISHYHIIEKLGEGGMGIVYKAEDTRLKRTVALKFLPPELTRDPEAKARFIREAQAASALEHPNICNIHEIDETEDGQLFIVMACYEGQTLKQILNTPLSSPLARGETGPLPLPVDKAIDIMIQIAGGLAKAHEKGSVHRDIKPANILITNDGVVKILDFGLAKLAGQTQLTKDASTLGTVAYMSPEQLSGKEVDQRTDIWSLGVVLYEMLTGKRPFIGEYEQAIIYAILNEDISGLDDLPPGCRIIIRKCLEKAPEDRFQTVSGLIHEGREFASGHDTSTNKGGISRRLKSVLAFALPVLTILIIAAFYMFKLWSHTPLEEKPWDNSIAVLPFDDLSQDKDQDYFCMGMTEQILSNLTRLNGLKVIARTSVMKYKDRQKTIPEIADELDVRNILDGSVQRAGDRVRIRVQLINPLTGAYLWSENYDSNIQDVFSVQDEVSQKVADVLNVKLKQDQSVHIRKYETSIPEAYEYCLKGEYVSRYLTLSKTPDEHYSLFLLGEEHFTKSLQLDPSYIRAKMGLAEHYLSYYFLHGDDERMTRARDYANDVLNLDPNNAFAVALEGGYYFEMADFDAAFIFLKQALSLNPNDVKANYYMARLDDAKGLYNLSRKHLIKTVQIDPLNTLYLFFCGECCMNLGYYDEAEQYFRKLLEFNPDHVLGRWSLFWIKLYTAKYEDAERLFDEHIRIFPDFELNPVARSRLLAIKGEKDQALALGDSSVYIFLLLNMKEEALNQLRKEIASGQSNRYTYLLLIHHPWFKIIRDDPRYIEIVARQKVVYENNMLKYSE